MTNVLLGMLVVLVVVFGTSILIGEHRHYSQARMISVSMSRLSESVGVLSQVCMAVPVVSRRNNILVVDDCEFDLHMIRGLCDSILDRHRMTMSFARGLDEAYPLLPTASVVVLDVVMADTSIDRLNALINLMSSQCPVVVNSINEYPAGTFPNAYAVCRKAEGARLADVIEQAIVSKRGGDESGTA